MTKRLEGIILVVVLGLASGMVLWLSRQRAVSSGAAIAAEPASGPPQAESAPPRTDLAASPTPESEARQSVAAQAEVARSDAAEATATLLVRVVDKRRINGGCRLTGSVLDQDGNPVAARTIWIVAEVPGNIRYFGIYLEKDVAARAVTDALGRYVFDDMAAGTWWVGPAPTRRQWGPLMDDAIAPIATAVEIPVGASQMEQDLRVYVGLYIRGKVLNPEEQSVDRTSVDARPGKGGWPFWAETEDDGTFAVGPLVSGSYKLTAYSTDRYADSNPVNATAGDEGLILHLQPGGVLAGRVFAGATGVDCEAYVILSPQDPHEPSRMRSNTGAGGAFRFEGLLPGAYSLSAHTEDGKSGLLLDVHVVADRDPDELVLTVQPGARIRVRYAGTLRTGIFTIRHQGAVVANDGLHPGESLLQVVPAGKLKVDYSFYGREQPIEKDIDIAVGEEKEVVFRDDG